MRIWGKGLRVWVFGVRGLGNHLLNQATTSQRHSATVETEHGAKRFVGSIDAAPWKLPMKMALPTFGVFLAPALGKPRSESNNGDQTEEARRVKG